MLSAAIATALGFGLLNILFEMFVLGMMSPRWRLAILGTRAGRTSCHLIMLLITLWMHWGTLGGTSGAQASFLFSFIAIPMCMVLWGWTYKAPTVVEGKTVMKRRHRRGILGYTKEELRLPSWIE